MCHSFTHYIIRYPYVKKLAQQLGMESVEELEAAIDAMQGIAEDGSEIESDNLAREARLRSAYMDWCKEYGKESDETRFKQFSKNYLTMEEYAQQSGKELLLNEFADCTEEEYAKLNDPSAKKPAEPKPAPAPKAEAPAPKAEAPAPKPAPAPKAEAPAPKPAPKTQKKPPAPKKPELSLEQQAIQAVSCA